MIVSGHFYANVVAGCAAGLRCGRAFVVCLGLVAGLAGRCAYGQEIGQSQDDGLWGRSQLVDLSLGGINSDLVQDAARQGFELSGGAAVDLKRWYRPRFPHLSAVMQTELSQNASVIWGASLGERGAKYTLGPTATLGVVFHHQIAHNLNLELEVSGFWGGTLREKSCIGDYGAIGGVQRVNCRLAASVLPPDETLAYLWNQPPMAVGVVRLSVLWWF